MRLTTADRTCQSPVAACKYHHLAAQRLAELRHGAKNQVVNLRFISGQAFRMVLVSFNISNLQGMQPRKYMDKLLKSAMARHAQCAQCVCVCVFFHAVTFDGSVFYLKHKREWRSRTHIWGPRKWWVFSSLPRHRTCSPAGKHGRCILVVFPWVFPWVSIQISKAVLWDTAGTGQGQILAARIVHLAEKNPKGRYRKYPGNLENVIGKHHRTIILETRLRSFLGLQTE